VSLTSHQDSHPVRPPTVVAIAGMVLGSSLTATVVVAPASSPVKSRRRRAEIEARLALCQFCKTLLNSVSESATHRDDHPDRLDQGRWVDVSVDRQASLIVASAKPTRAILAQAAVTMGISHAGADFMALK
jgi:ABC-type iron transport system FetAB permease component